jgi:hypothetical protein
MRAWCIKQLLGGRGDSGALGRHSYHAKPLDGHYTNAAGRRAQCQRRVMRTRTLYNVWGNVLRLESQAPRGKTRGAIFGHPQRSMPQSPPTSI